MKTIEKKCAGKCPKCNSENINWHDSELQDMSVFYNAICDDCGCEFTEHHTLQYEITQSEE